IDSAECGVRNAGVEWKVGPRVTMNWWRTDVTRHQQRWVSSLDTLAEESHERGSDGRARGHGARSRRLQRTRRGRPPARARGSGRLLRRLYSRPQAWAR